MRMHLPVRRTSLPARWLWALALSALCSCGEETTTIEDGVGATAGGGDGGSLNMADAATLTGGVELLVDGVQPPIGPPGGGTSALVRAIGMGPGTRFHFGGAEAKLLKVVDPSRAVVQVPSGAPGQVDVRVELQSGASGTLAKGFSYVAATAGAPTLAKVLPPKALSSGGTPLVIEGSALGQGALLFIGWIPVQAEWIDATTLNALSPPLPPGAVDVAVTNPDGQSALLAASLQIGAKAGTAPALVSRSPAAGTTAGGQTVTLAGANLDKGAVLIWGGEHVPQLTVESATTATVVTPKHAAGAVDITLINPDGQSATLPNGFVYMFDVPAVYTVEPKAGLLAGGNTLALSGYGFEAGMAVHVGSKPCDKVAVQDATSASCTAPAGDAAGPVAVKVTNTKGLQGQLPKAYTYLTSVAAEIGAVLPSNGPPSGGIPVVVKGKNLPDGVEVTFGGTKAVAIAPASAEVAAVTLPPGKPGPVDVALVVKGEVVASAKAAFVYDEPQPPVITKISPPTGPAAGGVTVVLEGTNLPANPTLTFGAASAQVVSAAATAIVLVLPPGSAGPVDVTVSGIGGSATSKGGFTYQAAVAPTVSAVVPSSGPAAGGIVVVVQGKDLSAKSKVLFGG